MDDSPERGTGTTTRQITEASKGAIYVYAGSFKYARLLALFLGRDDLILVPPEPEAVVMQVRGSTRQVVIDHALPIFGRSQSWRKHEEILKIAQYANERHSNG
jgi:hypothetical protein